MGAILSASVSAFALTSATYAWYVANNKVTSETSSIMAEANGFMLQIVKLGDTLDHGSDTALVSAVEGHKISPASTEDAKSWWVPENWNADMNVATYLHPTWDIDEKGNTLYGQYTVSDETYYAYAVGEYTLYTLTNTGICDVYLDGSNPEGAVQVTIKDADGKEDVLSGIRFQERLEERAWKLGNGKIPQQLFGDYCKNRPSVSYGAFESTTKGDSVLCNLRGLLPEELEESFIEGMHHFSRAIPEFDREDAILSGVESRTSSPVRIVRDESFQSNIRGIYPCGEGAGYAGGIMSAAMDGLKVAEAIGRYAIESK